MKHFLNLSVFILGSRKGWPRGLSALSLFLGRRSQRGLLGLLLMFFQSAIADVAISSHNITPTFPIWMVWRICILILGVKGLKNVFTPFPAKVICSLPPETGRCKGAFSRYFYNSTAKQCEEFMYGGCYGNSNRFPTKEKCESRCLPGMYLEM